MRFIKEHIMITRDRSFDRASVDAPRVRASPHSSYSICVTVFNLEPKSPNPANRFEKQIFEKKCQTWTALQDYKIAT